MSWIDAFKEPREDDRPRPCRTAPYSSVITSLLIFTVSMWRR